MQIGRRSQEQLVTVVATSDETWDDKSPTHPDGVPIVRIGQDYIQVGTERRPLWPLPPKETSPRPSQERSIRPMRGWRAAAALCLVAAGVVVGTVGNRIMSNTPNSVGQTVLVPTHAPASTPTKTPTPKTPTHTPTPHPKPTPKATATPQPKPGPEWVVTNTNTPVETTPGGPATDTISAGTAVYAECTLNSGGTMYDRLQDGTYIPAADVIKPDQPLMACAA